MRGENDLRMWSMRISHMISTCRHTIFIYKSLEGTNVPLFHWSTLLFFNFIYILFIVLNIVFQWSTIVFKTVATVTSPGFVQNLEILGRPWIWETSFGIHWASLKVNLLVFQKTWFSHNSGMYPWNNLWKVPAKVCCSHLLRGMLGWHMTKACFGSLCPLGTIGPHPLAAGHWQWRWTHVRWKLKSGHLGLAWWLL